AIIGYTEMLLEDADERGDEAGAKDQQNVREAAFNLLKIVDDVLDLTKIEAGKLGINTEVFPVIDLVESLGTTALPLAKRNNNKVKLKYGRELGYIRTDRTKLNRVLLDLLSNACKFTHDGRIELRVDADVVNERRFFVFSVSDTGIGISEEVIGRLFEPFRMADESSTREYGGLGLGLALAKHYTEMLGGEISVESKVGEGSTFRVRLPVEPEDPRESGHILVSMY
ncbi:MAG: HAMP domain-containing histidine kinase, partial [Myxococcales bacterium]|nr:HAMP domain-containing histidine kinase [Myxococcales bacterium]